MRDQLRQRGFPPNRSPRDKISVDFRLTVHQRCRHSDRICTRKNNGSVTLQEMDYKTLVHPLHVVGPMVSPPVNSQVNEGAPICVATDASATDLFVHQNQRVSTMPELSASYADVQNLDSDFTLQNSGDWTYPMYFENIVMPKNFPIDSEVTMPEIPDVASYMQDGDIWSNSFDIFNSGVFNFDDNTTAPPENGNISASHIQAQIADSPASIVSEDSLRARFDAFRRSPWYVPRKRSLWGWN
jgi:hypothetical protein